ncbi:hypothetical protein PGKDCPLP_02213 [Stenotrophomonas maltophilia]|nr:hypothetical protein PGKDCPLP_02213 [Stenotrophomonas maltophilia]
MGRHRVGGHLLVAVTVVGGHRTGFAVGHVQALARRIQQDAQRAGVGRDAGQFLAGAAVEHQHALTRVLADQAAALGLVTTQEFRALIGHEQALAGRVQRNVHRLLGGNLVLRHHLVRIGAHHHQIGQQVAGVDALVGRIQRQARCLGIAQAVDGVDHLQRGGIDHEQHAAHVRLAAVAGHVQAVGRAVDHQFAQVVGVGSLAILAGLLLHQLDGADGLVLRGVDHRHRQVHGVAHVQAVVGVIQHHTERLALQRDAGFHGQRGRVQAQHLGRAGVIAEATGRGHEHGVLLRAVGQLVQALGHGLALHRGGGAGGRCVVGECGGRAEAERNGNGQGGRAEERITEHASVLEWAREGVLARWAVLRRPAPHLSARGGLAGVAGEW